MKHNSAALVTFAGIMKVINHERFWDAKLTWYSPSATHQICFYGLEHSLRIHSFRLT